jgi:hypothetical protein
MPILLKQQPQESMKTFSFIGIVLALLMVCAFCYAPLRAQTLDSTKADSVQKPRENWYWLSYGAGAGFATQKEFATSGAYDISVALGNTLLSFNLQVIANGFTGGGAFGSIGAMYGLINRHDWSFSSTAIGVAYSSPASLTTPNILSGGSGTVGLVGEAQIALKAYVPGLGLKISAGVSPNNAYVLGMLVFHLGWMP